MEFGIGKAKKLILIRPPEWGGGKTITPLNMESLLGTERGERFLDFGIIRPIHTSTGQLEYYQMTAPGYLMWERKVKGPILELALYRLENERYSLFLCSASDLLEPGGNFQKQSNFPSWRFVGTKSEVMEEASNLILNNKRQLELVML